MARATGSHEEGFPDEHALRAQREHTRGRVRAVISGGLSAAGHLLVVAALFGPPTGRPSAPVPLAVKGLARVAAAADALTRATDAQAKRATLVTSARTDRARGALALGHFLIAANAIDAAEEGTPFDHEGATRAYDDRVATLTRALAEGPPERAVAETFGDLGYAGTPGGRMGDALLERSGSCEPLAQLVAAALFDAGEGARSGLRYYGGSVGGITHLAPVLRPEKGGVALDLMTQAPAAPGGTAFDADALVEIYARAHGLAEAPRPSNGKLASGSGPAARPRDDDEGLYVTGVVPDTRTLKAGYPPNPDRFEGALPLYAERAFAAPRAGDGAPSPVSSEPPPCPFYVRMAWLDPPHAVAYDASGAIDVEIVKEPGRFELARLASIIQAVQARGRPHGLAPRLLTHACLVALFDHAGTMFSLAGQPDVARRAALSAQREREAGALALAELALLPESERLKAGDEIDEVSVGRIWILLFLEGGEVAVRDRAENPASPFDRLLPLSAMIVAPRTRASALSLAETLPLDHQLEVMHELVHAHDNARPWAATYRLDVGDDAVRAELEFVRTYSVFYALSWRLWDATRSPEETIEGIVAEAAAAKLSAERQEALVRYYIKQFYLLQHLRPGGVELVLRADVAARKRGFSGLAGVIDDQFLSPAEREMFARAAGR